MGMMTLPMSATDVADRVLKQLEDAWNAGVGRAFAEPFAEDAEFVDIRGDHHTGRKSIGIGHQMIFDSVYKGSSVKYEPMVVKQLGENALYVLGSGGMRIPEGGFAGEHEARFSLVLSRREGDDWQIIAFHNTLVAPAEGQRPG
jgi:uncharacterized protein (TIGR02246 family)